MPLAFRALPWCMLCFGLPSNLLAQTPTFASGSTYPPNVLLRHSHDKQRLLVTGLLADGSSRDASREVAYTSRDPKIAMVDPRGIVTPVGKGKTVIEILGAGLKLEVPVEVSSAEARPVSFAHDVMPLLARFDCNSGGCHGAAAGKKGFKISLRGYDPASDYVRLTRGTEGRRLNFNEPERSLLVLKPTGQVPHDGMKRFEAGSWAANLLERWTAQGARSDLEAAPKLVGLEVFPTFRGFPKKDVLQQLLVTARFSDGSTRDVTDEARFSSGNEAACLVDENGLARLHAKGEATLSIRYGHLMALSNLVALDHDPTFAWTNPPEVNYVDKLVHAKLKSLEILPSDVCGETEFLRRVHYDLTGLPPTPEDVRGFLEDKRPDRRAKIIDALLDKPEHAEYWASKWADLLKMRFETLKDRGTWGLYRWLRDSIAGNKPYDQFVREIVTASGSCAEEAPANFYRVFDNPNEASEATIQVFFGIRLMCARCHDHPFEKWVQTDYYGMAAFFSQVGRKPGGGREDLVIFRTETAPQAQHSTSKAMVLPKLLDAAFVPVKAEEDARAVLAEWMTRKDNPFLARAAVNRFWSHLFGKGIIDPVDDIRSSNPPSNPALLDALAKDFVEHGYDVKHILRTMLNSNTYQRSARTNKWNKHDTLHFSHALPRRLSAEQVLDSLSQATGIREGFRSRFGEGTIALPAGGVRAGALPDRQLTAELLDIFGRPRGDSSCSCERVEEISLTLALHLINGQSVGRRLADGGGKLAKLAADPKLTDAMLAEELYLTVLCRLPRPEERAILEKHFIAAGVPQRFQAAQDAMWALFNSKEFLFNH